MNEKPDMEGEFARVEEVTGTDAKGDIIEEDTSAEESEVGWVGTDE